MIKMSCGGPQDLKDWRPDAKTIPIIAMTANAFKEDEEKCMAAGMNEHLAKPLEEDKVVRAIYENIVKKRA